MRIVEEGDIGCLPRDYNDKQGVSSMVFNMQISIMSNRWNEN